MTTTLTKRSLDRVRWMTSAIAGVVWAWLVTTGPTLATPASSQMQELFAVCAAHYSDAAAGAEEEDTRSALEAKYRFWVALLRVGSDNAHGEEHVAALITSLKSRGLLSDASEERDQLDATCVNLEERLDERWQNREKPAE